MTMLTKEAIFAQLDSTESFPIALSEVWGWLGYARKDNALKGFLRLEMAESIDFIQFRQEQENSLKDSLEVSMTVDCFKMWAMSAQTDRGREVRLYYIQAEKEWKQMKLGSANQTTITQEHVAAFQFDRDTFVPWALDNPTASTIFLGWKSPALAQALPADPVQQLNPKAIDPTVVLPDERLIDLIDNLSLAANRAGLAGNKSIKEAEFLDQRFARLRSEILELEAQNDRLKSEAGDRSDLETNVEILEQELQQANRTIEGLRAKLKSEKKSADRLFADCDAENARFQQEITALRQEIAGLRKDEAIAVKTEVFKGKTPKRMRSASGPIALSHACD